MSNLVTAFKEEIIRLARKELKMELDGLKKASASHRSEIAALKRRILVLEKGAGAKSAKASQPARPVDKDEDSSAVRFSAKRLKALRQRLDLSAKALSALVGVSAQTIYLWEGGKIRPRPKQIRAIATVGKMGKKELKAALERTATESSSQVAEVIPS